MAYSSKQGRRPNEYASKSAHTHVIKDASVQAFLKQCNLPKRAANSMLPSDQMLTLERLINNPIKHVIAIDGGYDEVVVQMDYPSATICFFQFGALSFDIEDLDELAIQPFIDPEDMAKLKNIQRLKFTMPVRNIALTNEATLTASVRRSLYDFFQYEFDESDSSNKLIDTLSWLIYKEYDRAVPTWTLASCPICSHPRVALHREEMTTDYTFTCKHCKGEIYLTDIFRLHEVVDDEIGAGGILGYVTTTLEQILLAHLVRIILQIKPVLLREVLFIKDGPLAFFGQTANMHKPMRALVDFLFKHHNLYLAGLEKSGPFVEHADEISKSLQNGRMLLLDNDYIYKYVLPGKADPDRPYGSTTYYGNKLIFKTSSGEIYVASLPTGEIVAHPIATDFKNLDVILTNIEKLKCDMYDSALMPIALANKLVSLSNHPSSKILQRFAMESISI